MTTTKSEPQPTPEAKPARKRRTIEEQIADLDKRRNKGVSRIGLKAAIASAQTCAAQAAYDEADMWLVQARKHVADLKNS
jgi:hypothetical protein